MNTKSIGVFGLSGVGKTTLINNFLKNHDEYIHLQAGSLIKKGMAENDVSRDSLRIKDSAGIDENQRILIQEYHHAKLENSVKNIIFDGHMVIDTDQKLIQIPFKVIEMLKLDKILVITAGCDRILAQRASDSSRKRPSRSAEDIHAHQELSTNLCQKYAKELGIPFCEIDVESYEAFTFNEQCLNFDA